MAEVWIANYVRLAWLIDPKEETAYIYRQGSEEVEVIRDFDITPLSGEEVLPGFAFPVVLFF